MSGCSCRFPGSHNAQSGPAQELVVERWPGIWHRCNDLDFWSEAHGTLEHLLIVLSFIRRSSERLQVAILY